MKTVFLIAGLDIHNTAADEKYLLIRKAIEKKGYNVIPVNISWKRNIPSRYVNEFISFYNDNKSKGVNIIIGNSFGAVVALLSSPKLKPDLVMLCSLSPFFQEDIATDWPPARYNKLRGKKRLRDISQFSIENIATQINYTNTKFKILYGEKEHDTSPRLVKRAMDIAEKITNSKLVEVKDAPHPFTSPEYISGIIKEL